MKRILTFTLVTLAFLVYANELGKKVAVVSMMKGDVQVVTADGKIIKIKKDDWLQEGSMVKTGEKSFAKLSFIDKSIMNVGPKSEMKIEKFSKEEAGVVNVISGKIRAQVTKDYLNMDKDKSKLFIKSKSAVMGIRGTDFMFSTNKVTGATTAVLFEGKVVFNKINKGDNVKNLEAIVNKGREIRPGQFSVVNDKIARPTVPAKLSSVQLKGLEKNVNFAQTDGVQKQAKSVAPPGLSGEVVASNSDGLKNNTIITKEAPIPSVEITVESKGFVKGHDVKPADGAPVDIDTGLIVPLGKDSTFDRKKGEWVSNSVGSVDAKTGDFIPPKSFAITESGDMVKVNPNGTVQVVKMEIKPVDQNPPLIEMPLGKPIAIPAGRMPSSEGGVPLPTEPLRVPVEGPAPASTDAPILDRPPLNCVGTCRPTLSGGSVDSATGTVDNSHLFNKPLSTPVKIDVRKE